MPKQVVIPFLLSFAVAYIINPVIGQFQARGVRRHVTVLALYVFAGLAVWLLAGTAAQFLSSEFKDLQVRAPGYLARARVFAQGLEVRVNNHLPAGLNLPDQWDIHYGSLISSAQDIPSYLLGLFPVLSLIFLVPFISFFLLVDGPEGVDQFIQSCPSRYVEQALHLISEIDSSLGAYLRGLIVVAVVIAFASFIGLVIIGVDQALSIAILSGVSSFVPYLGAIMGAVVGGLAATFQFGSTSAGLKVILLFAGIRLGDEILLQPMVAKHSVRLHPLVFLLTFMLGGELFGFMGLVFAVPAACVIKSLIKVAWSWYSSERQLQPAPEFDAAVVPYT